MAWQYYGNSNTHTETALFILCGVVAFICLYPSTRRCRRKRTVPNMLTPVLCVLLLYECILLALGDTVNGDGAAATTGDVTHALLVPLFIFVLFEIAYSVHKARSVQFGGIVFDQGHRINTEPCSWFLRYLTAMVALGLFVLGLLIYVAPTVVSDMNGVPPDEQPGDGGYQSVGKKTAAYILALIPSTVMALISLYLSLAMKKYGKNASMVVHSTTCNKWAAPVIGSLCMLVGQIPGECCFRVSSCMGATALLVSIVILGVEIEKEEIARDNFAQFLEEDNRTAKTEMVRTTSLPVNVTRANAGALTYSPSSLATTATEREKERDRENNNEILREIEEHKSPTVVVRHRTGAASVTQAPQGSSPRLTDNG